MISAMQPPCDPIPLDVLSEILDHVDSRTLRACAFLSASVLSLCHDRLFREIDLTTFYTIGPYLRLYGVLHKRPKLSQYVKSLRIRIGHDYTHLGFPCDDPILFDTFSTATNLTHLQIGISPPQYDQWHSPPTVTFLYNLLLLPGVRSVTFTGWIYDGRVPHIPTCLVEVPIYLRNLSLERIELWGCSHPSEPPQRKPVRPSSISITRCDNFTLQQLFHLSTDANSPLHFSSIKKLSISPPNRYEENYVKDFFRHVFDPLKHLTWVMNEYLDSFDFFERIDSGHLSHLRELNVTSSLTITPIAMEELSTALSVFIGNIPETTPFEVFNLDFAVNYSQPAYYNEERKPDWALAGWKELGRMLSLPRMKYVKKNVEVKVLWKESDSTGEFEEKIREVLSIASCLSLQITWNLYGRSLYCCSTVSGRSEITAFQPPESLSAEEPARGGSIAKRLKRFFVNTSPFRKRRPR